MPLFNYKGVGRDGKTSAGVIDAESEKAGRIKLRRTGVYVVEIYPEGQKKGLLSREIKLGFQNVKTAEIAHMTRQMAVLLGAGVPLVDTLKAMQNQIENPKLAKAITQIKEKVVEGVRLAEAMKAYPKIFSDIYISMIRAGEASGSLEVVLNRLADFTEYQANLKSKIKSAMTYPMLMSVLGTGVMVFLLTNVIPKILASFDKADAVYPLPTRIVVGLSGFLQNYWFLLIVMIIGLIFFLRRSLKTVEGRKRYDKIKLKFPYLGVLVKKLALSRFSRTLATLLKSGVQLIPALDIVKDVVNNLVIKEVIEGTIEAVREGDPLADTLKTSPYFPAVVTQMIMVGEKTGSLEEMLERVSSYYDTEVETAVDALTSILGPVMILVMAAGIGFMVAAVMLPIFEMTNLVS